MLPAGSVQDQWAHGSTWAKQYIRTNGAVTLMPLANRESIFPHIADTTALSCCHEPKTQGRIGNALKHTNKLLGHTPAGDNQSGLSQDG